MDSLDFFRRCIWPLDDRDEADARLEAVLAWVGQWALPERVFGQAQLDHWATTNGYTTTVQTQEIAALLRAVQPHIVAPSELATRVNDMIYAYG